MNIVGPLAHQPFKLRETVFRSNRYKSGCLCPGAEGFKRTPCPRCAGPFIVTKVKEVGPMAQTGWIVSVKHKRSGKRYAKYDSSWFVRR